MIGSRKEEKRQSSAELAQKSDGPQKKADAAYVELEADIKIEPTNISTCTRQADKIIDPAEANTALNVRLSNRLKSLVQQLIAKKKGE